jgi:hypothetical protein
VARSSVDGAKAETAVAAKPEEIDNVDSGELAGV